MVALKEAIQFSKGQGQMLSWHRFGLLVGAALLAMSTSAPASAALFCTGKLSSVALSDDGRVLLSMESLPIHSICNTVTQGAFRTQAPVCKSVYATLLAARLSDRQVRVYYSDPALTSCSQISSWSIQPTFYFVELPQ